MKKKTKGTSLAVTGLILVIPTTFIGLILAIIALAKSIKTNNSTGIGLSIGAIVTGVIRNIIFIVYGLPLLIYIIAMIFAIIVAIIAGVLDYNIKKEEIKPIEDAIKENIKINDDEIQIKDYHFKVDKY